MEYKEVDQSRLSEIVTLNESIFSGMYDAPPYSQSQYTERLEFVEPFILIAESDDGHVCADSIGYQQNDAWYIWILGVEPGHRNKGVASHLCELNEEHARRIGCKSVTMKVFGVSREMLTLVRKRGYVITKSQMHQDEQRTAFILELIF